MPHTLDISTTAGETFTAEESYQLAALIYKRFGREATVAAAAWRRLFRNSCTDAQFVSLVDAWDEEQRLNADREERDV
jgi:hypothetical protein